MLHAMAGRAAAQASAVMRRHASSAPARVVVGGGVRCPLPCGRASAPLTRRAACELLSRSRAVTTTRARQPDDAGSGGGGDSGNGSTPPLDEVSWNTAAWNSASIIGWLAHDVELVSTKSGARMAKFVVGVDKPQAPQDRARGADANRPKDWCAGRGARCTRCCRDCLGSASSGYVSF